jgi:hypothetical protein
MPTLFDRGQQLHPSSPNPRTKTPLIYALYFILRTQADSHRIPINTELTEQKRSMPDAVEHHGFENVGVSTRKIFGIYGFVCLFVCLFVVCLFVCARTRLYVTSTTYLCTIFRKKNIDLQAESNTVKF